MSFIPGTLVIKSIGLENYKGQILDISDLMSEINIYESIYTNTITGTISVIDSYDLAQLLPIIGEERIYFEVQMPDMDQSVTFTFSVYRISDRVIRSDKIQNYTLWFTSEETLKNLETRVSKSWQMMTVDKVVQDIVTNQLKSTKPLNIEKTVGIQNYIAPAINPLRAINFLASNRAINSDRLADFVFFENFGSQGPQFNFASLGTLLQKTPVATITHHPVNMTAAYKPYPLNVDELEFKKSIDTLESRAAGLYNQTVIFYDHLRKKYVVSKTNYEDIFNDLKQFHSDGDLSSPLYSKLTKNPMEFFKIIHVDEFPSKISDPSISNVYTGLTEQKPKRSQNAYMSNSGEKAELNASLLRDKILARRTVLLQEFENNKIYLKDLAGNMAYTIGKTINLEVPHIVHNRDVIVQNTGDNLNKYISGKYLITKVRHRVVKHKMLNYEYKCHLEIAKNSFKEKIK